MYNNYQKQNQNSRGGFQMPQMQQMAQIPQIPMMPQAYTPMPRMQGGYSTPQNIPQGMSAIQAQGGSFLPTQLGQTFQPILAPAAQAQGLSIDPATLRQQAEEFSRKNPEFQLEKEIENPQFCKYILENKLTIEEAYTLTHREELMGKAKAAALEDFRAKRDRISENGTGRTAGAAVKMNPKDMDDKDIAAIIERVRRGEKISF